MDHGWVTGETTHRDIYLACGVRRTGCGLHHLPRALCHLHTERTHLRVPCPTFGECGTTPTTPPQHTHARGCSGVRAVGSFASSPVVSIGTLVLIFLSLLQLFTLCSPARRKDHVYQQPSDRGYADIGANGKQQQAHEVMQISAPRNHATTPGAFQHLLSR